MGKLQHYSVCVDFLRLPCATLARLLGEDQGQGQDWDRAVVMSQDERALFEWALWVVGHYGPRGRPLWPSIPSSAYGAYLRQDDEGRSVLVLTVDASVHGWRAVVRSGGLPEERLVYVGHYRDAEAFFGQDYPALYMGEDDPQAQVHREAAGMLLALRAVAGDRGLASRLRNCTLLVRGDCMAALAARRKGSSRSATLQRTAIQFAQLRARLDMSAPLLLHVPGEQLVAEGVNALSRDAVADANEVASLPELRALVLEEAKRLGWRITVNLYASLLNAITHRYYSRGPEPEAEGWDALAQPDCPSGRLRADRCAY